MNKKQKEPCHRRHGTLKRERIMKLCVLLTCLFSFVVLAKASAQEERVNLDLKEVSLKTLFNEIQRQTALSFVYSTEVTGDLGKVTVKVNGETVESVLSQVLAGTGLTYRFEGDIIVIRRAERVAEPENDVKSVTVTGRVTDVKNQPLPGVTVQVKGVTHGTVTDVDGHYKLVVPHLKKFSLMFSFVGMKTQEIEYVGKDTINVVMEEDVAEMDEVVVTGYQTVSRRESASSISTIKADEVMMAGVSSIDQMLQGTIPGMSVMMTSGEPSATPKIRIRGNATINGNKAPVWVVDGVILEQNVPFSSSDINSEDAEYLIGNAISGLNPRDIETITVLKDASATAIYGVRAANGVIVITTKRGAAGRPHVSYNGDLTINMKPSYRRYDLMDSQERVKFAKYMIDMNVDYSKVPSGDNYESVYESWLSKEITDGEFQAAVNKLQMQNTDWFDLLFKRELTHTHTLTLSGGSENARYYVSAGYSNVKGGAIGSKTERYNVLAKVDVDYNDWLSFTTKVDYSSTSNTGYASSVNPMNYATTTSRTIPAYDADGSRHLIYQKEGNDVNDYIGYNILNELDYTGQSSQIDNLNALLSLNVLLWKGLKYEGTFSVAVGNTTTRDWAMAQSYYVSDIRGYEYGKYTEYDAEYFDSRLPYGGILTQGATRKTGYVLRNMLSYSRMFGVHDVSASVGTEATRNKYVGTRTTGYGWDPEFGEVFNPVETDQYKEFYWDNVPSNTNSLTQVASFFGIVSYCYNNRYVLNLNIRSDGSNKFGSDPKYRWLPTWSGAMKWIASSESFLRHVSWLNNLSFRASYGIQGNITDSATPNLIVQTGHRDGDTGLSTYNIVRLPNPELRWEKTRSWNVAVDFAFWDGRIQGNFEVYRKNTSDLITSRGVPASTGRTELDYNVGKMTNKGFEGYLDLTLLNLKDWHWRFGVNFGRNLNEVTLANEESLSSMETVTEMLEGNLAMEGRPVGAMFSYHFAGLNQENGYPLFYTKDGRKAHYADYADLELVYSGSIFPKLSGGFSTDFSWKNMLYLSMSFAYSLGNVGRLPGYYNGSAEIDPDYNYSEDWLKAWTGPGDDSVYPVPVTFDDVNDYLGTESGSQYDLTTGMSYPAMYTMYDNSDLRVAKADFLKLRMVSLRYRMPKRLLDAVHLSSAELRLQATNLFTIANKKWKGFDPESEGANIPALPAYSLGLSVTF